MSQQVNNKKILLVQLFSNGDCLYATTVARQIKKDFPGCYLTWAIADNCKNIIAGNPYVDEVRIVQEVVKTSVASFRSFKKQVNKEKKEGRWDEVFITHNMDDHQALYDGTIRGMIFRAYPFPITVPVEPVLVLNETEIANVAAFAAKHQLQHFKNVILWEYAPQSGQSLLSAAFVMKLAGEISSLPATCVILTSANSFVSTEKVIDASPLSVRENAALTHYCNLLIGCSSGITWLSTSSAAKRLPMLQLLNPQATFFNAPSVDFQRYQLSTDGLIEMMHLNETDIFNCVNSILNTDFQAAKAAYHEPLPLQFNTTRKVVYNMLCYLQFAAIAKHYRIITSIYGNNPAFLKQFWLAIVGFPFKLLRNLLTKKTPG